MLVANGLHRISCRHGIYPTGETYPPKFSTAQFGFDWITKGLNLRSAKRQRGYRDWDVEATLSYTT